MKAYSLYYVCFFISFCFFPRPSSCGTESFVYGGCSQLKYNPGTPYESNVNSILTSFVNSASSSNFNKFKISLPGSTKSDVVYGLYQCRGDQSNSDCRSCIANAVSQLGSICVNTIGGALQLDGCFVKYDNTSFIGEEDKTTVYKKCGPSIQYDSDALTRRDSVLAYLSNLGQFFRIGGSGKVQAVAQCTEDLSASECQNCLSEAIQRLEKECGPSPWGDMFLAKCYARYSESDYSSSSQSGNHNDYDNYHDHDHNKDDDDDDDDLQRTLAITIGLIAGVAILIVFISVWSKSCDRKYEDGK